MSSLAAELEALRRGRYAPANPKTDKGVATTDPAACPEVTEENIRKMCTCITPTLENVPCFDVMGNSTQVVVVEEESPLNVPFIAAQETQVSTCFVWSAKRQRYTGVLTVTEYLKVLLYCVKNPKEVDRISALSVKEWRDLRRSEGEVDPEELITAIATDSLTHCIMKMMKHGVRRLAVVADDATTSEASILSVLTYPTLLQFMVKRVFGENALLGAGAAVSTSGAAGTSEGIGLAGVVGEEEGGLPPAEVRDLEGDDSSAEHIRSSCCGPYNSIFDVPYNKLHGLGYANQYKKQNGSYPTPFQVSPNTPIADALQLMLTNKIHAVPVVEGSIIIDVVTRNDVIRMETGGVFDLTVTVREALLFHNNQHPPNSGGGVPNNNNNNNTQQHHHHANNNNNSNNNNNAAGPSPVERKVAVFYEYDTLQNIIGHFATMKVQVLFLVNPQTDELQGQLSLSEVLWFLSKYSDGSNNNNNNSGSSSS